MKGAQSAEASVRGVTVVVDSSTCLEPETAREFGITVVPMHIVIDGHSFRDLVEITPGDFYRSLRSNGNGTHSTSAPAVGDYATAFEAAAGDVLCLTVAGGISGMHQSARIAAEMTEGHRVEVLDSGTAAGGLRLLALEAARRAAAGGDLGEVAAATAALASRVRMFGALDSIDYLARSGRVPQVASWGAEKLGVKPVVEFAGGKGSLVTLARGRAAARHALADLLVKRARKDGAPADGTGVRATIFHADAAEEAELLRKEIAERMPRADLSTSHFTPAMGVHTGPGVLGHAFYVEAGAGDA